MDENPRNQRSGGGKIGCALAGLILVPILYVLSSGPAFRLMYVEQAISEQAFSVVYAPVKWTLYSERHPYDLWLWHYILWWLPHEYRPATNDTIPHIGSAPLPAPRFVVRLA